MELDGNERVVVRAMPHARALRAPAWTLVILMAVLGFLMGVLSRIPALGGRWAEAQPFLVIAVWLLFAFAVLGWVITPVWRWSRRRIILTTRRVLVVQGTRPREMPLVMVTGVTARPGVGAGQDGPGTLVMDTVRGRFEIRHVPDVRKAAQLSRWLRSRLGVSPEFGEPSVVARQ